MAAVLTAYALLLYPMIGIALGHDCPAFPAFGKPCPVVIFTFGAFCFLPASIPRFAIAIPSLWVLIGSYAPFGFHVYEDLGLIVGAIAAIAIIYHATHRTGVADLAA